MKQIIVTGGGVGWAEGEGKVELQFIGEMVFAFWINGVQCVWNDVLNIFILVV